MAGIAIRLKTRWVNRTWLSGASLRVISKRSSRSTSGFLGDEASLVAVLLPIEHESQDRAITLANVVRLVRGWDDLPAATRRKVLTYPLAGVMVRAALVDIKLFPSFIDTVVDPRFVAGDLIVLNDDDQSITLRVQVKLKRRGRPVRVVIDGSGVPAREPDPAMLCLVAKAQWPTGHQPRPGSMRNGCVTGQGSTLREPSGPMPQGGSQGTSKFLSA